MSLIAPFPSGNSRMSFAICHIIWAPCLKGGGTVTNTEKSGLAFLLGTFFETISQTPTACFEHSVNINDYRQSGLRTTATLNFASLPLKCHINRKPKNLCIRVKSLFFTVLWKNCNDTNFYKKFFFTYFD